MIFSVEDTVVELLERGFRVNTGPGGTGLIETTKRGYDLGLAVGG